VIVRIELIFVYEMLKMRDLKRYDSVRGKQICHPLNKVIAIRDLLQYVVTEDQVSPFSFRNETLRESHAEKFH